MANVELHVHHNFYDREREPWEYHDHEMKALCKTCHERFHNALTAFRRDIIPYIDVRSLEVIVGALSVGMKFNAPLVIAHALGGVVADPAMARRLATQFQIK